MSTRIELMERILYAINREGYSGIARPELDRFLHWPDGEAEASQRSETGTREQDLGSISLKTIARHVNILEQMANSLWGIKEIRERVLDLKVQVGKTMALRAGQAGSDTPAPRDTHKELIARITGYLVSGGLFNPEMALHDRVRDLLIDCRDALSSDQTPRASSEGRKACKCTAEYRFPNGRTGAWNCHTFTCMLDAGHEGEHKDWAGIWHPEWEKNVERDAPQTTPPPSEETKDDPISSDKQV